MKHSAFLITIALMAGTATLPAQSTSAPPEMLLASYHPAPGVMPQVSANVYKTPIGPAPISRFAFGGGMGLMGINMQAAVNVSRYMNLRGTGNFFQYTVSNISTNGLNLNGKFNFATAGASVDLYPFPNRGFRVSPGAMFYNQNNVAANLTVAGGTSFTLNNVTYYASNTNPITGNGSLSLNTTNPAFTMTTGWGNMISHKGGHLSFPFEVGAAFIGVPTVNVALTSGQACNAQGQNCVNVATDPNVQANLAAQIAKYKSDLNPFKYYPIVNFGVAYSFGVR